MAIKPAGTSGFVQNVVVINDFGLQERTRTSPVRGKTTVRYTVSITGTPLPLDLNPHELGRRPAEAMAEHLRARIRTLQAVADNATIDQRKAAAQAFDRGEAWALKRYAGGRLGTKRPGMSDKLFNDSGRLADGLIAKPIGSTGRVGNPNEWVINVAANRFDPSTLTGPEGRDGLAALQSIYHRLVELIPEFGNPRQLVNVPSVRAAIEASAEGILARNAKLTDQLRAQRLRALGALLDTFGLGGIVDGINTFI
jgi:hypothetical protein